jgi:hypothetical protein
MTDATTKPQKRWLGPGVAGIGTASLLSDLGYEAPTALLPSLLTATLGAPASAFLVGLRSAPPSSPMPPA